MSRNINKLLPLFDLQMTLIFKQVNKILKNLS